MWQLKLSHELKEVSKTLARPSFRSNSPELQEGFAVVSFSPGWVKTDMNGGVDGPAPLFVEQAGTLA